MKVTELSLGKNAKLVTWDKKIWYFQVYDADTSIGLNNSGSLIYDIDIEMGDKGVFNTTGSKLWTRVQLLFKNELEQQYAIMRQKQFTVDNMMKYIVDEQISSIPMKYYNIDMQSKYLNYGSSYLYALHGSGYHHIKKWLRERLIYCDTLFGYNVSTSDYITLRSNKLGEVYLDIQTYIPLYVRVKWRDESNNSGVQVKRVGRGETVRFSYSIPTQTDQEIIVYAGHYLKSLGDVSNLQPSTMLIANADRLTEITCHSPNLINTDLSECTMLQRIDLSDSTKLGTGIGAQPILNIQNCKYLRYCNCMNTQLTAIYTMQQGGNLEELYFPETTQVVQVTNQTYLHTIGIPYGYSTILDMKNVVFGEHYQHERNQDNDDVVINSYKDSFRYDNYIPIKPSSEYAVGIPMKIKVLKGRFPYCGFIVHIYDSNKKYVRRVETFNNWYDNSTFPERYGYTTITTSENECYVRVSFNGYGYFSGEYIANGYSEPTTVDKTIVDVLKNMIFTEKPRWMSSQEVKNLATVQITNCNSLRYIQYPFYSGDSVKFDSLKYVQNLTITNSMPTLTTMSFKGFNKLRNVTLENLQNLTTLGFDNMLGANDTSTFKTMTLSNIPKVTKITFNVDSNDYKIAFAGSGKIDVGGLKSATTIESNYSMKGLDTIILPTSIKELRFSNTYGDGINEIKNLWSATSNHATDGFTGIDFQDMNISHIDMLGLSQISNAINFNIAPVTQHPNMNTNRDGSETKTWFKPTGTINLNSYTGSMVNMLKGVDLSKLIVALDVERPQTDLTSLFQGATITTSDITKINNILSKFPSSTVWDYMFAYSNIQSVEGINIGTKQMSLKGMFKGSNVTKDILIPSNVVAVDEMFMNCLSLVSISPNWNNVYTYGITATNCYAGCGLVDLDEVPTTWGGRGFSKNVTGIYVVDIPTDDYTISASSTQSNWMFGTGIVNWGDGTLTIGENQHTYVSAGTYTVKGHIVFGGNGEAPNTSIKTTLTEVKQLPLQFKNLDYAFESCTKLKSIEATDMTPTTMQNTFRYCSLLSDFSFITTWDMRSVTTLDGCFEYSGVIDIDLSNKKLNKLLRMRYVFANCSNLTTINLTNFIDKENHPTQLETPHNLDRMFYNCPNLGGNPYLQLGKCMKLIVIQLGGCLNVDSVLDFSSVDTSSVSHVIPGVNTVELIGINTLNPCSYSFRDCTKLTKVSDCYMKMDSYDYYYYSEPAKGVHINFVTKPGSDAYKVEKFPKGTHTNLNFNLKIWSTNHNVNTFISLFNCLYDYASEGKSADFTLELGETNLARLTTEQKAIAINKGWTLA